MSRNGQLKKYQGRKRGKEKSKATEWKERRKGQSGLWQVGKKAKRRHKNGKEKRPTGHDMLNELSRREGKPSTFETSLFCAYKGLKDASSQS
jgi:hypothetical protein